MPRHRGFSLVELLVVIAIIAALVGILVPARHHARVAANDAGDQFSQHVLAQRDASSSKPGIWGSAPIGGPWTHFPTTEGSYYQNGHIGKLTIFVGWPADNRNAFFLAYRVHPSSTSHRMNSPGYGFDTISPHFYFPSDTNKTYYQLIQPPNDDDADFYYIEYTPADDDLVEGDETFNIELLPGSSYELLGDQILEGVIYDVDD